MAASSHSYFQLSRAITSILGLTNLLLGFLILSITRPSPIVAVAMITPAAGAVANGLCIAAFYSSSPVDGGIAAAVVADICWLLLLLPSRRYSKRLKASLTELFFFGLCKSKRLYFCSTNTRFLHAVSCIAKR